VAVRTVIFDWGGTLTPWHTIDHEALWHGVCVQHYPQAEAADVARAIYQAELAVWQDIDDRQQSATLAHVFERAGVTVPEALLGSYFQAWEPHTFTDPDVPGLLRELRRKGIRIGSALQHPVAQVDARRVFRPGPGARPDRRHRVLQ